MNVLSLFDGMSCGQIALERVGIKVDKYFAAEIDKHAIKVTMANYPDTIQLGDVTKIKSEDLPKIDLLIGGSPCQGFSFAGKQLNFDDSRSKLFFEYVRLLNEIKPKYFLLENVKMKKESQDIISQYLGVEPVRINSDLVSAQNRLRLYWTNIPDISQPEDKGIILKDILCNESEIDHVKIRASEKRKILIERKCYAQERINKLSGKCQTLMAGHGMGGSKPWVDCSVINDVRALHPIECERLQTVPDNYTGLAGRLARYKMLGNGWTVDVIAHIFKEIIA